jgi:hypothetical protein
MTADNLLHPIMKGHFKEGNTNGGSFFLKYIYYVPSLKNNLASVSQTPDSRKYVFF